MFLLPFETRGQGAVNLPPDVPPFTFNTSPAASPGWLLISATSINPVNYPSTLMLVNEEGDLVFYLNRNDELAPPYQNQRLGDFQLQNDGRLSFATSQAYFYLDSTFSYVDSLQCGILPLDAHDMLRTSDGHYHFFCELDSVMDLSGMVTAAGDTASSQAVVRVQLVVETDSAGNWLWYWNPLFATAPTEIDPAFFTDTAYLDLTHYNSLAVDPAGNYLLSSRHLNQISYLNKLTGQYIWRLGGQMNDFTLVGDTVWFTGQHHARFHPGGRLSLYDNATVTAQGIGRGIEYLLDTVNMTATADWVQENEWGMKSQFVGSHQLLPNGNRLIGWGGMLPLTQSLTAQEFNAAHQEVMSVDLPAGWISYRVMKFDLPWALHRPVIACDSFELVAPAGHATYYWSTGETSQSITPVDTGFYQVWVSQGAGMMSSELFHVTDVGNPCGLVGLSHVQLQRLALSPNPAEETTMLSWPCSQQPRRVSIIDVQGREWRHWLPEVGACTFRLDLDGLPAGLMLVKVEMAEGPATCRLLKR